jgi:hypothetical protein
VCLHPLIQRKMFGGGGSGTFLAKSVLTSEIGVLLVTILTRQREGGERRRVTFRAPVRALGDGGLGSAF